MKHYLQSLQNLYCNEIFTTNASVNAPGKPTNLLHLKIVKHLPSEGPQLRLTLKTGLSSNLVYLQSSLMVARRRDGQNHLDLCVVKRSLKNIFIASVCDLPIPQPGSSFTATSLSKVFSCRRYEPFETTGNEMCHVPYGKKLHGMGGYDHFCGSTVFF